MRSVLIYDWTVFNYLAECYYKFVRLLIEKDQFINLFEIDTLLASKLEATDLIIVVNRDLSEYVFNSIFKNFKFINFFNSVKVVKSSQENDIILSTICTEATLGFFTLTYLNPNYFIKDIKGLSSHNFGIEEFLHEDENGLSMIGFRVLGNNSELVKSISLRAGNVTSMIDLLSCNKDKFGISMIDSIKLSKDSDISLLTEDIKEGNFI